MTQNDRFGLNGAPEVQAARRIQFGQDPWLLLLFLRAFMLFLKLLDGPQSSVGLPHGQYLGWEGYSVLLLEIPLLLYSFWIIQPGKSTAPQRQKAAQAFTLSLALDFAARLVSDQMAGRPLDQWSLILLTAVAVGWLWMTFKRNSTL